MSAAKQVPFKNFIGQIVQPGDRVVVISRGWGHAIYIREGMYLGLSPSGYPSCQVIYTNKKWDNGKYETYQTTRRTTLKLGRIFAIK